MTDGQVARRWGPVALLAVLAYVPALTASPGRMPSDSKLYLYLDPGGFLGDAASSFDPGQFAGWVPHQHVSYLWPAGPWFWLFEQLSVPDWVAHRLWIGTLMFAAGLGVRWSARLLGLGVLACSVAGLAYQVSPYVLPYVSRTSVMLLPWAGLGWIVGLVIRATGSPRRWRHPAAIALVVLTVGSVNATALAMIVPAPVLWLVHETWARRIGWRDATVLAARTALLSAGVSSWWVAGLVIQGRYGAEVLPFSESLADVSLTATSAEVWRSLGYWLFYVRDPYAATTTESLRYLISTPAIVISFAVPAVCLVGLVWVRWAHRRYAAALVVAGGVLAVGVHPIGDRSPLMRLLAGSDDGGIALALRSSTRALPLLTLGLALAAASLVDASPRPAPRRLVAGTIAVLVLVNLPGMWTGAFVDPALERDQDPPDAWVAAAATLDDRRVLMLPGVEFGAYRWGYTVDQPLPGLADAPLVTRDLLPLGSPAAMDLVYALDDRIQDGVIEAASIGPVARWLGASIVWSTNDVAFDRFRTTRPEIVRSVVAEGIGTLEGFGEPVVNVPDVAMDDPVAIADTRVGQPLPPVELGRVEESSVVRARTTVVAVAGSGDGLVDLAAAGLLDGDEAVRYTASLTDLQGVAALFVTDSHRAQARHWRSSQDTRGLTEPGPDESGLFVRPAADQRLTVVADAADDTFTYAEQRGPVRASATSYGEPFAYLPEHRPLMAVDGDPNTAWTVGDHGDPIGQILRLWSDSPIGPTIRLHPTTGGRRIDTVRVTSVDQSGSVTVQDVVFEDATLEAAGREVLVPADTRVVELTVTAVSGSGFGGVGFTEVDLGLAPTREVVVLPSDATGEVPDDLPLAYVLTRWRVDPLDEWRSDPEPSLVRGFSVPGERTFDVGVDVRLDPQATDDELASVFGWPVSATTRLSGSLYNLAVAAFDGDDATSWVSARGAGIGSALEVSGVAGPIRSLSITPATGPFSRIRSVVVAVGDDERRVSMETTGTTDIAFDPPLPAGDLRIVVTEVESTFTTDRRHGDVIEQPVAIAEIVVDGVDPIDPAAGPVLGCVPVADLDGKIVTASVDLSGWWSRIGAPLPVEPCVPTVTLAGSVVASSVDSGLPLDLDRLVLDDGAGAAAADESKNPGAVVDGGRFERTVTVTGCPDGCWLVFGEGFNTGWSARVDGRDLGAPVLIDGGFNGWWLDGGSGPVTVTWRPQRLQVAAISVSLAVALLAVFLVVRRRVDDDGRRTSSPPVWSWDGSPSTAPGWVIVVTWTVVVGSLAGPWWALVGAFGGLATARFRRVPVAASTSLAALGVVAAAVVVSEARNSPLPDGGWPVAFERFHWVGMFAFAALAVSALTDDA
jgi:arabinofuranan 3-O-arabinosyltransferase